MFYCWLNLYSLMVRPSFMRDCGSIPHGDLTFKRYSAEVFPSVLSIFVSLFRSIDFKSFLYTQPNFLFSMSILSRIFSTSVRK